MSIASRINEMTEHLRNDWNSIDKLGLDITEENSNDNLDKNIENIAPVLNRFYNQSSDKTDLSENGIVGRTSQSGTPTPDSPQSINNLTGNVSYKITTKNGEQTFIIPLGDIELCGMGTYEDKIYSNNGRFYLEKNTDKIILNGDELIDMFSVTGGKLFRCRDIAISVPDTSPVSNYFKGVPNSSSRYDGTVYYNHNASADRMVFDILTTKFTTVGEFKSWLSTHNTELQFPIPTPTTTEITQENYPTLYSQLLAIQEFLTKYKINNEFLLDYSSPEIEY